MSCQAFTLLLALLIAVADCTDPRSVRSIGSEGKEGQIALGPIDWEESAGVFIGVETFHGDDPPLDVRYAADDATDLAYLFANDLRLLPPSHTVLMVAGRPNKERSRQRLRELQRDTRVILDDVDAKRVSDAIAEQAPHVGPNGVLVLSIATHGYTREGQHVLLTADSGAANPKGLALSDIIRQQRRGRLLLFVDACRERLTRLQPPGQSSTALTESFFDELRSARGYAVLTASVPGGFAYSDDSAQNGFFTGALLDAFRRQAAVGADGCIVTLSGLHSEVSRSVLERSGGRQRPEARFGGGVSDLCIVDGNAPVGGIVSPHDGDSVPPSGDVEIHAPKSRLYATVLLCAARNNVCFNQTPNAIVAGPKTIVHVNYGTHDRYAIWVALCTDPRFLHDEIEIPNGPPLERRTNGVVRWLGPVTVTFKEASS